MDSYEAKDLIGKKVIGFNLCYLDERGLRQGWLIETIEAVGKDWVVTRGKLPSFTILDNVVERLKTELVTEGEQGCPISESQRRSLLERMAKSMSKDKEWRVYHLEDMLRTGRPYNVDAIRRNMS